MKNVKRLAPVGGALILSALIAFVTTSASKTGATETASATPTVTATATATATATVAPSVSPSASPGVSPSATATVTPSATATPSATPTVLPSATATPVGSPPPPVTVIRAEGGIAPILPSIIEPLTTGGLLDAPLVVSQPFTAAFEAETVQPAANNTTVTTRVVTKIYRDLLGRVRREQIFYAAGATPAATDQAQSVTIHDPVARYGYSLNVAAKTAERFKLPTTLPTAPPISDQIASAMRVYRTENPATGATTSTLLPAPAVLSLGAQTIAGVPATGKRVTTVIPAGAMGNQASLNVVYETWFALDLGMLVKCTITNPATGSHTLLLKSITRTAPAASLFTPPADYAVREMGVVRTDLPPPR